MLQMFARNINVSILSVFSNDNENVFVLIEEVRKRVHCVFLPLAFLLATCMLNNEKTLHQILSYPREAW